MPLIGCTHQSSQSSPTRSTGLSGNNRNLGSV
jgi:hypothetical protein